MGSLLFILNPIAGGGKSKDLLPLIEKEMLNKNMEYEIMLTTKPKDAIKFAEKSNQDIIIAVGGDGTVNEVAKGLIKRKAGILAIIPGGTGNDMARSLDIPMDPIEALKRIFHKNTKEVDLGIANGHYFLNIASAGFDAEVVRATNSIKNKIKGKFAYVLGILYTIIHYRKKQVTIDIDGESFKRNLILLAVGNGKYYGGGLMILPESKINDGYLHICLVKDIGTLKILFLFPSIFKGNHIKYKKYVEIHKAKKIQIETKEEIYFNLDGEIIPADGEIKFEIAENEKLRIIC